MKKFYLFNWIFLFMGLISFTTFGQTTIFNAAGNSSIEGWSYTNNVITNQIQQSSYWLIEAGDPSDIITSSNYIGNYTDANLKFEYATYGSGSNPVLKIEYSTDNGDTYTLLGTNNKATSSTYVTENSVVPNFSTSIMFRFSNENLSGKGVRLKNIVLTGNQPINTPPTVSSKTITGTYGVLLTDGEISATNNPTSWTQTGMPTGIDFDMVEGIFSGTPTQAGTFTAEVTATNEYGTSAPANVIFEIAKANQTVNYTFESLTQNQGTTFTELPSQTDQGVNIVYTSADNSIVSTNGNTLSFDGVGSTTITATAASNVNYNEFSTTFNVSSKDPNIVTYNGQGTFVKVTNLSDVTDGYYVVTNEKDEFLMTNTFTTFLASSDANVSNGEIVNPSVDNVWKIESDMTSYTIYNEVLEKYVGWTSGNSVALSSTLTDNYKWTLTYEGAKFTVNNVSTPVRQLSYNSGSPRFAAYGNTGQEELQLYKLIPSQSTTWENGAWSNGTPDLTKDIIVKDALVVETALEAKTITVLETIGSVTVRSNASLIVDGKIDNQAGAANFVLENESNLIQNNNVTNTGSITVNRDSNSMVRNDMTFWSSPVQQDVNVQTIRSFSPETLYNRFWTYNETTDEFSQILTSDTDAKLFEAGKGVSIRVRNTLPIGQNTIHNGSFLGVPYNGDITVPVEFTANGYNLVGNPYASNINVEKFLTENTDVNSLYFWTHQFPVGSSEYANNYAAFNVVGSVIPGLTNISVGQGFIVGLSQATSTVRFNNEMRTAQEASFYKNSTVEKNRIWLSLSKDNNAVSQILLAYMDGATNDVDNQIDAKVMQRGSTAIYSVINDDAYAIQGRSLPFNTEDVVKLGLEVLEQGDYAINIEQVDGLFEDGQIVYLKDKVQNKVHNLSEAAYSFTSKEGISDNRFELIFADKTLGTDELTKNDISIYNTNNSIVVKSTNSNIVSVQLFDVQGRKIVEQNSINSKSFNLQPTAKGFLVIKVLTEDGKVKTQKIINK